MEFSVLQAKCHEHSLRAGWWDGYDTGNPRDIAVKLALIHSEISEALEAARTGCASTKLPGRSGLEEELACAVIRILDLAGRLEYDLLGAILEKVRYNITRKDHHPDVRAAPGGKKF